jgi:hypothetical protein
MRELGGRSAILAKTAVKQGDDNMTIDELTEAGEPLATIQASEISLSVLSGIKGGVLLVSCMTAERGNGGVGRFEPWELTDFMFEVLQRRIARAKARLRELDVEVE